MISGVSVRTERGEIFHENLGNEGKNRIKIPSRQLRNEYFPQILVETLEDIY